MSAGWVDIITGWRQRQLLPFGDRRRLFALLLMSLGVFTFFFPLLTFSSPVHGRARWSALNIAAEVVNGNLCTDDFVIIIALLYALLPTVLIALYFENSHGFVASIASLGSGLTVSRHLLSGHCVKDFFAIPQQARIDAGPALLVLPYIMPALLLLCVCNFLDD